MIPQAKEAVDRLNKLDPNPPGPGVPPPALILQEAPEWNAQQLFAQPTNPNLAAKGWPPSDPFTIFLMASLTRFTYYSAGQMYDIAKSSLTSALGGDYEHRRVSHPTVPGIGYDIWHYDQGYSIFAFKGTTKLSEWLTYAIPVLIPMPTTGTTAGIYAGIATKAALYTDMIQSEENGVSKLYQHNAIMTGHSLGGALAQILGSIVNVEHRNRQPNFNYPVQAEWTFGAPAFLSESLDNMRNGTWDIACRVYLEGDPIPFATQLNMSNVNGILPKIEQLFPSFPKVTDTTRHLSNKELALVSMPHRDAERYRIAAIRALVSGADALVARLVDQHSMKSYCYAAQERCRGEKKVPLDKFNALVAANAALDAADDRS